MKNKIKYKRFQKGEYEFILGDAKGYVYKDDSNEWVAFIPGTDYGLKDRYKTRHDAVYNLVQNYKPEQLSGDSFEVYKKEKGKFIYTLCTSNVYCLNKTAPFESTAIRKA